MVSEFLYRLTATRQGVASNVSYDAATHCNSKQVNFAAATKLLFDRLNI